jgi:hypothetical protein
MNDFEAETFDLWTDYQSEEPRFRGEQPGASICLALADARCGLDNPCPFVNNSRREA